MSHTAEGKKSVTCVSIIYFLYASKSARLDGFTAPRFKSSKTSSVHRTSFGSSITSLFHKACLFDIFWTTVLSIVY